MKWITNIKIISRFRIIALKICLQHFMDTKAVIESSFNDEHNVEVFTDTHQAVKCIQAVQKSIQDIFPAVGEAVPKGPVSEPRGTLCELWGEAWVSGVSTGNTNTPCQHLVEGCPHPTVVVTPHLPQIPEVQLHRNSWVTLKTQKAKKTWDLKKSGIWRQKDIISLLLHLFIRGKYFLQQQAKFFHIFFVTSCRSKTQNLPKCSVAWFMCFSYMLINCVPNSAETQTTLQWNGVCLKHTPAWWSEPWRCCLAIPWWHISLIPAWAPQQRWSRGQAGTGQDWWWWWWWWW